MPLPPGQPVRMKAVSVGPLFSMPGFFSAKIRHSRPSTSRAGDGAEHSCDRKQISRMLKRASGSSTSFQPSLHLNSCQRRCKQQKRLSPFPARPPTRWCEAGGSRWVCAHSKTTCKLTQTHPYIYPAAFQQLWCSAAVLGSPPMPLPPGQPARRKAAAARDGDGAEDS